MTVDSAPAELQHPPEPVSPGQRRWALAGILIVALAWIGILATLVVVSSNPVVLNRTQIAAADVIVEGRWRPGSPPQVEVDRVWKGQLSAPSVVVHGTVPVEIPGEIILVPLSRITPGPDKPRTSEVPVYQITQGDLPNLSTGDGQVAGRLASVRPQVYPASEAARTQLQSLLSSAKVSSRTLSLP